MSIKENLQVADNNISDSDIEQVLKRVMLWDWINSQPEKLNTNLGTLGGRLSGGQKQRLALARVLLKKGLKLLILDEATAALDYNTESFIYNTIFSFQKELDFTCIIVAHRLKSIKNADSIVVLREGDIIEEGTHID
eukprot:CAMPEP_0116987160 /NCGR_PEP_ID=MMETSP0467-20121206/63337_1 /TAXON_ID=283647 /ORGANISM="Mesodinium pulex, Strain SPMC105" /LENGTH=136 /DNA_ID=CAMNT_0004682919 /DNA_START=1186 /DNA_END=1596 /DNA_ORIENTATION=-